MRYLTLCVYCLFIGFSSLGLGDSIEKSTSKNIEKSSSQKISFHRKKARELLKEQKIDELKAYFKIEEVNKDPQIQTFIGNLYYEGTTFDQSYVQARDWWKKAAIQGYARAQTQLASLYFQGLGVKKNHENGMLWLNKALDQNDDLALFILAMKYSNGDGLIQDYQKAVELYEKAASQGHAEAQLQLGELYIQGKGVEKNFLKAFMWFQKAADEGLAEAQFHLGVMHLNGEGIQTNFALGQNYIELAAKQGFADAQLALGIIYASSDYEKARQWFEKAAAQGNEKAKVNLGILKSCSLVSENNDVLVELGNVIYSFGSGKMQCQSEIDEAGNIFVLLKSLDKNSTISFSDIVILPNSTQANPDFVVKTVMSVAEDTDLCASWINIKEVMIRIEPLPTKTTSLTGKQVYNSEKITVMVL